MQVAVITQVRRGEKGKDQREEDKGTGKGETCINNANWRTK